MNNSVSSSSKTDSNPTKSSENCWYLAVSKPRQEIRAVEQLNNQQIKAFCPTINREKIIRGKKQVVTEALFTSYIFINLAMDSPKWHKVRSTRGIRDWVRFSGNIAKLPEALVDSFIAASIQPENNNVVGRFARGDSVQITAGPFSGLTAIYDKDDGEERSMILVEFLGKINCLKIANEQISTR